MASLHEEDKGAGVFYPSCSSTQKDPRDYYELQSRELPVAVSSSRDPSWKGVLVSLEVLCIPARLPAKGPSGGLAQLSVLIPAPQLLAPWSLLCTNAAAVVPAQLALPADAHSSDRTREARSCIQGNKAAPHGLTSGCKSNPLHCPLGSEGTRWRRCLPSTSSG